MNPSKAIFWCLCLGMLCLNAHCQQNASGKKDIRSATAKVKLDRLELQPGFKIEVWAAEVPNARSMALSDNGTVFVGTRQGKNVYGLVDEDKDGKADVRYTLATGLDMPNGVAYKDGDLYVAEVSRILKFADIQNTLAQPSYEVVFDGYPSERHHGWKFIAFGPDGLLYVPVGAPCNICESENPFFASITRLDISKPGSKPEIYAHGVRNSVGFDWHPVTKELWFTDNGRDLMGDDIPDCELNHATAAGQHFGYPYWHAGTVKDPDFGDKGKPASAYIAPSVKMGPHNAPLGMRFYRGSMFPEPYHHSAIIAKHGSWNRSKKAGYEVEWVAMDASGKVTGQQTFITGWLDDASQEVWGRPVDVLELPDGSLLISDDMAGCIYRVTYSN
ncbi:sorbosone dehydrogenase family protein [Algoriphagus sp. H41]|uniref:Sorbosone dehydrogenase family protein n=1 Tax=Algoriphagus oliviformis TaxID=2811231 RepID=A0ABS3C6B8_9BACT|nr:PQQ-dependent sugar dehydrogenase [Algoriphagus oliviformis]MBN7812663.1 sorbosone dehydrogenase family protein [Algoriphagus oliviformis]